MFWALWISGKGRKRTGTFCSGTQTIRSIYILKLLSWKWTWNKNMALHFVIVKAARIWGDSVVRATGQRKISTRAENEVFPHLQHIIAKETLDKITKLNSVLASVFLFLFWFVLLCDYNVKKYVVWRQSLRQTHFFSLNDLKKKFNLRNQNFLKFWN